MSKPTKHIHSFHLECDSCGMVKRIFMDGEELAGVTEAHIDLTIEEIPTVILTTRMLANQVDIDFPTANVVVKRKNEGDQRGKSI